MDLNLSKCSATGKTRFPSPGAAKEAMIRLKAKGKMHDSHTKRRYKRRGKKAEQCRYYRCKFCNGYHLTSSAPVAAKTIQRSYLQRIKSTQGLVRTKQEAESWKADGLPFPEINNQ